MVSHFLIRPQINSDLQAVARLHEAAFGPGRFARTAYRIREASAGAQIALTAWDGNALAGAIQLTAIKVGGRSGAMLLGPLAIADGYQGKGGGRALMREGLRLAQEAGVRLVVLVGDLPYYARAGFRAVPPGQIVLPGPADPARILAVELEPGALATYRGLIAAEAAC